MNRRDFVKMAPAFPAASVSAALMLREEGQAPVELDVAVLKCQPGDTLVLRCDRAITQDTAQRIKASVEHLFGGRVKVMVLGDDLRLEGVLRA